MTETKLKIIPLLFATNFMSGHPRHGEPTEFVKKVKDETKIHTIRGNFEYWNKNIQQVRAGEAYLSLRTWTGKPYRSKQQEFLRLHDEEVSIQKVRFDITGNDSYCYIIDGIIKSQIFLNDLIENDGLNRESFASWFGDKTPFEGAIIHFTNFRY